MKFIYIKVAILHIIVTFTRLLSKLITKIFFIRPNVWIINSMRFSDNTKYLYFLLKKKQERVVWVTRDVDAREKLRDLNIQAINPLSYRGVLMLLRAQFVVYDTDIDDGVRAFAVNAKKINVWHGMPLKKIAADSRLFTEKKKKGLLSSIKLWLRCRLWVKKRPDFLIATSTMFQRIMAKAFLVDEKDVFVSPQPRNDAIYTKKTEWLSSEDRIFEEHFKNFSKSKNIMYAPTYRDSGGDLLKEAGLSYDNLNSFLEKNDSYLWIRLHPNNKKLINHADARGYKRIIFVDNNVDINLFLSNFDALITDYSSIYFDYLLLNRPIIFFAFDLDKYLNVDHDMYFDYYEMTPGEIVENQKELEAAILEVVHGNDNFVNERQKFIKLAYDYQIQNACEEIYHEIISRFR